jgi:hypothetical protein
MSLSHWGSLTELLRFYAPTHRRFIRCWRPHGQIVSISFHATVGWTTADPSIHPVLKASSWRVCLVQTWTPDRLTIPSTGPSVHPTLLSSWLLFSNSSDTTKKGTVASSDSVKLTLVVTQCTKCSDAMHWWYHRFIQWCLLPSISSRLQLGSLLQLNILKILNMPLLIASKYILSPQICYK